MTTYTAVILVPQIITFEAESFIEATKYARGRASRMALGSNPAILQQLLVLNNETSVTPEEEPTIDESA